VDYTPQFIALITQFSSMQFNVTGTTNGKQESDSFSYTTTSPQSGIYNVTVGLTTNSTTTVSLSFLVDSNNNTVLSASYPGVPIAITGSEAKSAFDGMMSIFGLNEYFSGEIQVFTDPAYFTNQGTKTMTFGTVSFPVTTYVANSPNESISYCGVTATITAYTLQIGTPPGTSLQFITYLHFAGTSEGNSEDITFALVSITVRS
jgi:hypothetical protein